MAERQQINLVASAQARLREVLSVGSVAVDATLGSGGDSRFLAEAVGEGCAVEITIPASISGPVPEWVLIQKPLSGYTGAPGSD